MNKRIASCVGVVLWASSGLAALGQISPSDGSDGVFNPTSNVTIDLSEAAVGPWDSTPHAVGKGVYDPDQWAVVFHYQSVNVPSGVTVSFLNNHANAPVVWLVQGDVTVAGIVDVSAEDWFVASPLRGGNPGPGGFRGGIGYLGLNHPSGSGFGPGGGMGYPNAGGGSYATPGRYSSGPTYGNAEIQPLIGGSGGSGSNGSSWSGAGGGGAILVASNGTIAVSGNIDASGGRSNAGDGSGGAIRLVADTITGNGRLTAQGGNYGWYGGDGRIRLESATISGSLIVSPPSPSYSSTVGAFLSPATTPRVRIVSIAGVPAPLDPRAEIEFPNPDVSIAEESAVPVVIETRNVPTDWSVVARVARKFGAQFSVTAAHQSGDQSLATWTALISFPNEFSSIQVKATAPAQ